MQHILLKDYNHRSVTGLPSEYSLRNAYWGKTIYSIIIYFAVYYHCVSFILNNLCKASLYSVYYYLYPITYMIIAYCTYYLYYIVGADFKSYLEITYGCSLHASYWRKMHFIICEPCDCIHIETYWRKLISLFTYNYNSMLYITECRNIIKILIITANRTILSNLTTSIHV